MPSERPPAMSGTNTAERTGSVPGIVLAPSFSNSALALRLRNSVLPCSRNLRWNGVISDPPVFG